MSSPRSSVLAGPAPWVPNTARLPPPTTVWAGWINCADPWDHRTERPQMKVLIIGAAGMIGRKLTDAILRDQTIGDRRVEALHLADVIAPVAPASDSVKITTSTDR